MININEAFIGPMVMNQQSVHYLGVAHDFINGLSMCLKLIPDSQNSTYIVKTSQYCQAVRIERAIYKL